jgi:hypothetical protein
MTKIKFSRRKRTGGQGEDDDRSLHLSDLQGEEDPNELSMISHESDDDHDMDLNMSGISDEDDSGDFTENESFASTSDFPSVEENDMNQTLGDTDSLHLSDLNASTNASTNTTREEESFGGKRKTRTSFKKGGAKSKKRTTKSKKRGTKSKKSKTKSKKSKTKKHRKTLKKKGGYIGDNGTDMERYGETNPYSVEMDSDPRY